MLGKIVNGYTLTAFKGSGSFGSVYVCQKNNSTYAMKIFNLAYVFNEFLKGEDNRITREIAALKSVNHPNVVSYVDDGSFTDNGVEYFYVVMDYIEGEDLQTYIANHDLSVKDVLFIFQCIADGVDAIHSQHIVHRDLKPANIYVTSQGEVKILDFGLSKLIDFTSITSTGAEIGSPLYMSPEQVKDSKNIDYRSDYYALGNL